MRLTYNLRPDPGISRRGKDILYIVIAIGCILIYAPPFCIGGYQNHLYIHGPKRMYNFQSLAERGKTPLVILYTLVKPERVHEVVKNRTALHHATYHGYYVMARFLIYRGADVNSVPESGISPLTACLIGDVSYEKKMRMYRLLTANGAEVNGHTISAARFNTKILTQLLSDHKDVDLDYPLLSCIMCEPQTVDLLIEHGANVNAQDSSGATLLIRTLKSAQNNYDLINHILKKDVDLNIQDNEGNAVLHYASGNCLIHLTARLISKGANPLIINNEGKTPIDLAKERPENYTCKGTYKILEDAELTR